MARVQIKPGGALPLAVLHSAPVDSETRELLGQAQVRRIAVSISRREVVVDLDLPRRLTLAARAEVGRALCRALVDTLPDSDAALAPVVRVRQQVPPPAPADAAAVIAAAWDDVAEAAAEGVPRLNGMLRQATPRLEAEGRLLVELPSAAHLQVVLEVGGDRALEAALAAETGWRGRVVCAVGEAPAEVLCEPESDLSARLAQVETVAPARAKETAAGRVLRGRAIGAKTPVRPLPTITEEESRLVISGQVVGVQGRELKSGRVRVSFSVTDLTDTIECMCFRAAEEAALEEALRPGMWVRVRGPVQADRYRGGELVLMAEDIEVTTGNEREDKAPEKRVELHLHTKMSAMDALVDIEAAVARAARWGHPAIAVTDHGVAQSFPEAYAAGKRHGIKVILGLEAYLVDDGTPVVARPPADLSLAEACFVVADIETTGLSPISDELLEIGAVKVQGGEILDTFHVMINPGRPIPPEVMKLTGITDAMVADGLSPDAALSQFLHFAQGGVLVAHNAAFDYSFLRFHAQGRLGVAWTPPVLDTIIFARAVLPQVRQFGLAHLTRELDIKLDNHHRALSDARATNELLQRLLAMAAERGVQDVGGLNSLTRTLNAAELRPTHATVLVAGQEGLKNLYKLVTRSHLEYYHRTPRIPVSELSQLRSGLLLGSGCDGGALYQALLKGAPDNELEEIAAFYDYLEIMPRSNLGALVQKGTVSGPEQLDDLARRIYELGRRLGKPVVATGDVHFLDPHEQLFRQILKTGIGYFDEHDAPLYFRTTDEMLAEFAFLGEDAARAVVIENSRSVADLCEQVRPVPEGLFPPKLPGAAEQVRAMTYQRAHARFGEPLPAVVAERLERELQAIIGNNYAVLYLIAHKLVRKSLEDGYLVGSRGSVGSSLVATMCEITEVNPLPPHYVCPDCHWTEFVADGSVGSGFDLPGRACPNCGRAQVDKDGHDIPFETFMGFEGDKVPDIDLNFSGEEQHRIHRFTEELFGSQYVFRAGTISTIAEKTAYGFVRAWMREGETERVLREAEIDRLAKGIAGVKRTTGQHPGGLMVVPAGYEVEDFCPVQFPADDKEATMRTTHFDYHSIHDNLTKLDILGHDDPTALRLLQDITGVDVTGIAMDDPKVLSLFRGVDALGLAAGQLPLDLGTVAVPEFGTMFVRQMLKETGPDSFSDLVRISGLSHGTDVWLGNAQELIRAETCTLKEVIPSRDDIMVYLMYQGVEPRTAFKIMEDVRKGKGVKPEYAELMQAHGVPRWYIESCNKIKYMFPKAHATAYVMMGLRVAWFKVYYPKEFYAVYFSVRATGADAHLLMQGLPAVQRVCDELEAKGREATAKEKETLIDLEVAKEALLRGVRFLRVDLYASDATRYLVRPEGLLPPFTALQGLGAAAARSLVAARGQGEFHSVEDLRVRTRVTKTVIELLQAHGSLSGLPEKNQLVFGF